MVWLGGVHLYISRDNATALGPPQIHGLAWRCTSTVYIYIYLEIMLLPLGPPQIHGLAWRYTSIYI